MAQIQINDTNLYYEIHGKGQPLMLVSGLASDSQSWGTIVDKLSKHYMLIMPDNIGSGRTTTSNPSITIEKMADDCMALARALKLDSFAILGHSMGGFLALDCAIRYPQIISKLILEATGAYNFAKTKMIFQDLVDENDDDRFFRNIFYWLFSEPFFADPKLVDEAIELAKKYPFRQSKSDFMNQVKAINDFDCRASLKKIKAETLIINGENDGLFPLALSRKSLQSIANSKGVWINEAAHAIHLEKPDEFVAVVLEFLKGR